jgi:hypothetical protein
MALINAASGLLGALIGAGAVLLTTRGERREQARGELTRGYAEYLGACDQIANQLRQLPLRNERELRREQKIQRIIGARTYYAVTRATIAPQAQRFWGMMDRYYVAAARLRLVASDETLQLMRKVDDAFESWAERPGRPREDMLDTWLDLRGQLEISFRNQQE